MKIAISILLIMILPAKMTFNFKEDMSPRWRVVNDGVMGGLSEGVLSYGKESVTFKGKLSLENNGGFASFRSEPGNYDLSPYQTVTIKYRGYGGKFGLRFTTTDVYYMPYYKMLIEPTDDWQTTTFRLRDFNQYRLLDKTGVKVSEEALSKVQRIGLIKSDKKEGEFLLEVDYIAFE
jgi:hypothetical protein